MADSLLPIGSVVLLQDSSKRVMVIGVCQQGEEETIWDYAGCLYPEGVLDAEHIFLFNSNQIEKIYFVGYQDQEQFAFMSKLEEAWEQYKAENDTDGFIEE